MKNEKLINKNLLKIDSENLIKRYNQALLKMCGFETALTEFYIDATGYSPQIAKECANRDYLNLNRSNRLFILLNLKQSELSVLDLHFTSTDHVFKEFLKDNRQQLFTLTSLSVVYGEFENHLLSIDKIEDVLDCSQIEFSIYTPNNIVEKSLELNGKIERFMEDKTISYDCDEQLQEIIELSHQTGDTRVNKFEIKNLNYKTDVFYTSHLGGNYIFDINDAKTIISEDQPTNYDSAKKIKFINIEDKKEIYKFLTKADLIKQMEYEDILEKLDVLEEIRENMLFDIMVKIGALKYGVQYDKYDLKKVVKENSNHLTKRFIVLDTLINNLKKDKDIDEISVDILVYLFVSKTEMDSVKMTIDHLISRLTSFNYTFAFYHNRALFDKRYESWSDDKKLFIEEKIIKNL